jgi:hypothetical protein
VRLQQLPAPGSARDVADPRGWFFWPPWPSHFDILARDKASQTLDKVGDKAAKTGDKIEHSSRKGSTAFGLLGRTLASSSQGALAPLADLSEKLAVFDQAVEQGNGSKRGAQLFGLGLAATAAGSFIEGLHSQEQGALQQLQASIEATGHSYAGYSDEIEKAVKHGENFGDQASQTLDALNRLTITTHDPEEALKALSAAFDVAAAKHIPLSAAADRLGLVFNGSSKAGKQFGVVLEQTGTAGAKLAQAQKQQTSALDGLRSAQGTFNEKQTEWNQSSTHTVAQAYALDRAHTALQKAQEKAKTSTNDLKSAQEKANEASSAGARNIAKVAEIVAGQGNAAAKTFSGELRKLRAEIEDTLGRQGSLGRAIDIAGPALAGLGGLAQTGVFSKIGGALGSLGGKFKTLRDVEVVSSAEGSAAIVANAAVAEGALATEAAAAEVTASRMKVALAGLTAVGAAVVGAIALKDYLEPKTEPNKDIGLRLGKALEARDQKAALRAMGLDPDNIPKKLADTVRIVKAHDAAVAAALTTALTQTPNTYGDSLAAQAARQKQLIDALGSDNPNVAARAQKVAAALAATKPAHKKAGTANGDAYLQGLLAKINSDQAAQAAKDAAVKNAQAVVDAISGVFQSAQSRLQSLVSTSMGLRQSITSALQGGSALTDIFQGPNLNANGAFGAQNNFGRVKDFLQRRVAQERRFVLELRQLMKQGLDPALVAQIASAGVDGGQRVAEAILSGGGSGIGQVNTLERQIASLANTTGKSVADQHYAKQIAEQRRTTEVLGHKLDVANSHLSRIQGGSAPSTSAHLRTTAALSGV